MYETAILKPFRLKTTNGDRAAYYGNCHVNITSLAFDNMKNRNKSEPPFLMYLWGDYSHCKQNIKIVATTHVLAVGQNAITTSESGLDYNIIRIHNDSLNNTPVQLIPNLTDTDTFTSINDFINSIKDKQLRKSMQAVFYNIAHGESPYANADYIEHEIHSSYVFQNREGPEKTFIRDENVYPSGANNYPTNTIIFIPQEWSEYGYGPIEFPCFFYRKNTMCKYLDLSLENDRLPCYGISMSEKNTIYFYWTTYKGV